MSAALTCSLSGAPASQPVISLKTGHIYERSTISKYISVYAVCPHTGQPLAVSDLLPINNKNTIVTAPQYSDAESMIKKIQNEYEALVLETSELKKNLA